MTVRRLAAVGILLAVTLGGCLSTTAPSDGNATPSNVTNDTQAPRTTEEVPEAPDRSNLGHVHDVWQGRSTMTLVSREVAIEAVDPGPSAVETPESAVRGCDGDDTFFDAPTCLGRADFAPRPPEDGGVRIAAPGTAAVEGTVSWSEPTITGVHLWFRPAYEDEWVTLGLFGESGENARVTASQFNPEWEHFPLTWTDDGHARTSRWQFAVSAYAGEDLTAFADGAVDVEVTVHRTDGELPLEPPHPDWYGDTSTYELGSATRYYNETWEQVQVWWFNQWQFQYWMFPENPVPPGTEEVVFAVNTTNGSPTTATEATRPEYTLYYWTDGQPDWNWPPGTPVEPSTRTSDRVVFRIPVPDQATDSLYTCSSSETLWGFVLSVHPSASVQDPLFPWRHGMLMHYDGRLDVHGMATERQGADPADLSPSDAEFVPGCEEVRAAYG